MSKTRPIEYGSLVPDPYNANIGSERGDYLVHYSLQEFGAGRSIVTDKNGVVIAGNKTLEKAAELGLKLIEVETDGQALVVVKRNDMDLMTDPKARQLAYADNRASELSLTWDVQRLADDAAAGIDLSGMWFPGELDALQRDLQTLANVDGAFSGQGAAFEDGISGASQGNEIKPANIQATIGQYRFTIDRQAYLDWQEGLRQKVGFHDSDVIAEIRRLLGL